MTTPTCPTRDTEFWLNRWKEGNTGWHIPEPNKHLLKQADIFLCEEKKYRIFVPLCGKSLDLLWLYHKDHEVVGLEISDDAIVSFGQEHELNFQVNTFQWGNLYQTADERLKIYTGNLFEIPISTLGKFDAVWDRGSLVAIDDEDRIKYSCILKQLLKPNFRYLLSATEYTPTSDFKGPPSSTSLLDVDQLFGDVANLEILDADDRSKDEVFVKRGVTDLLERIILLKSKTE